MKRYTQKWFLQQISCIICTLLFVNPVISHPDDEIYFFNVGQGHAVLIRKGGIDEATEQSYTPLLIDAGTTSYPFRVGERYEWVKDEASSLSVQIANQILRFWKESHGNQLRNGKFRINIIVTHPDKDHQEFIPSILEKLGQESVAVRFPFTFKAKLLLGGKEELYPQGFNNYRCVYSNDCKGLLLRENLGFLESSGCITHLFCPEGIKSDANRWSIITRIQLDDISAVFTGDADSKVKRDMLASLQRREEFQADILHVSHHGAEGTFHKRWDEAVNPKAIVIGSGLHNHKHPRGIVIQDYLCLLNINGRLWGDRVMPHALQYYCAETVHEQIGRTLETKGGLFDVIPFLSEDESEDDEQWHLVWTDAPVYTLWTTGTLIFKRDVRTPIFKDASSGMSSYIAVSDPRYLFDPSSRGKLTPLSEEEQRNYAIIPDLVRRKFRTETSYDKEGLIFTNLAMKEFLLISNHADRDLYLYILRRIFEEIKPFAWRNSKSFQWIREAVVERNRHVPENEERLRRASEFLFRNSDTPIIYKHISTALYDHDFEESAFLLKTFLKSQHSFEHLRKYVIISYKIRYGFSAEKVEILCPFGFPEWLQLEKLVSFVNEEIIRPSEEPISLEDVFDIFPLRLQGKNFKEIGRAIIEAEGLVDAIQGQAIEKLKELVEVLRIHTPAQERINVDRIVHMQSQGKTFGEIRQVIVESEGLCKDLEKLNEIRHENAISEKCEHIPLTFENFISSDGHPTTLEEFYQKLEEYFPKAMEEFLT